MERGFVLSENQDKPDGAQKPFPWGWVAVVGVIVVAVASQSETKPITASEVSAQGLVAKTAPVAGGPQAEEPIADATLKLAARHAGLALGADGVSGASAYSVNCWASLERTFSVSTVERCAAFDALVLANASNDAAMPPWFAEDTVAARYQAALSSNSVTIADMPARLERLRVATAIQTVTLVVPKTPKPVAVAATDASTDGESADTTTDSVLADNSSSAEW